MDLLLILLQLLRLGKKKKTILSFLKSFSKESMVIFIQILLKRRTPRGLGRPSVKFAHKLAKDLFNLYLKNC